jgi:hypothetical protein
MLLTTLEKYEDVLKITKKYNLIEREVEVMQLDDFIPKIHWYNILANYMLGNCSEKKLIKDLIQIKNMHHFTNKGRLEYLKFVDKLSFTIPELFSKIKSHLFSD